ncbi:hypothetical protein NPIL_640991, partial [Nephila pilipes]
LVERNNYLQTEYSKLNNSKDRQSIGGTGIKGT